MHMLPLYHDLSVCLELVGGDTILVVDRQAEEGNQTPLRQTGITVSKELKINK